MVCRGRVWALSIALMAFGVACDDDGGGAGSDAGWGWG